MTFREAYEWLGIPLVLAWIAWIVATLLRARRRVERERSRQMQPPTTFAAPGEVLLHIRYPGAAVIGSLRVKVLLDQREIGEGPVRRAFDLPARTTVGVHELELNGIVRTKKYAIDIAAPGTYVVRLTYDRTWGNFSDSLALTPAPPSPVPGDTARPGG